jgi:NADH dehydrogenase (ubiquinone) 1 alpha/beta subcomplex 1
MAEGSTYLPREQVTERVVNVVKKYQKVEPSSVTPESDFSKDLGLDSLDSVEVMMAIEEEFGVEIPDAEADKIETCRQAIDFLSSHPTAK